jgi:hypothetical protein
MLLGGAGAAALVTMPDVFASAKTLSGAASSAGAAATQGHFFLYGVNTAEAAHTARVQAAKSPVARAASLPAPVSVTTELAATPVLSPDARLLALAEVAMAAGGASVTVTVISKASGAVARTARLALAGVPADAVVLVTPAFSPSATTLSVVMAISVPSGPRMVRKADPRTGGSLLVPSATWRSHHALAYLDLRSGALAGPFRVEGGPSLALSTAVATDSELFLWTTADPQAVAPGKGQSAPLPWVAAFALGTAKARFSAPSSAPGQAGCPPTKWRLAS